ncbi:MAG: MarR family transcriptional regulator [Nanoarchaeota archaeon]|jgi:uncharacterized membrane protein|nr:MarR family transcriptional regulator [Nanoarchaeota archaeon]
MENKKVGSLILGIATAMLLIVYIFNRALNSIVATTCTHGTSCTMYDTMTAQYALSLSIVGIIVAIGLYVMLSKPNETIVEKTIIKEIKEKKKKLNLSGLDKKEKAVIKLVKDEGGVIFQAELKDKLEIGKVGVTRLLDKLESKGLIERKRRGMNNVVVLKE